MAEWWNGGMAEWRIIDSFDEKAVEKNGGMAEWLNGRMVDY